LHWHRADANHIKSNGPNAEQYPNVVVARINDHHKITYQCRKMPFPLVARDWIQRGIFTKISDDKFVLVFKFIDEKNKQNVPIFTPSTLKLNDKRIRGEVTYLYNLERLPHGFTKLAYIAKVDIKGSVPKVVAESGLSGIVDGVRQAYRYFERDEEIDMLERADFIAKIEWTPSRTNDERRLLETSLQHANYRLIGDRVEKFEDVSGIDPAKWQWKRIQGGDVAVKRFSKF